MTTGEQIRVLETVPKGIIDTWRASVVSVDCVYRYVYIGQIIQTHDIILVIS